MSGGGVTRIIESIKEMMLGEHGGETFECREGSHVHQQHHSQERHSLHIIYVWAESGYTVENGTQWKMVRPAFLEVFILAECAWEVEGDVEKGVGRTETKRVRLGRGEESGLGGGEKERRGRVR